MPQALISKAGIYAMPAAEYHADPVVVPSLSRSIARLLVDASPAHAFAAHPRLGVEPTEADESESDATSAMMVGTAVHAAFLDGEDRIVHIEVAAYTTKAAREARDAALAAGKIPLKTKHRDHAMRVLDALQRFRADTKLFTAGRAEQTVIWDEGDHWARARVDWLPDDPSAPLLDLKTTGGLAKADTWARAAFSAAADIQAAMYARGCEFVRGEPPDGMLFVVVETTPPCAIRVFGLDPVALEIGQAKAALARTTWVHCLATNQWPAYPREVDWVLPPAWMVRQWETSRAYRERSSWDPAVISQMMSAGNMGG